ncbi:hypothetical protein NQ318_008908 [Aromia moschata]|uniref:Uncharacterized protein n=1 Tax=Aromia moschata TaxID=1265417 RepID=A0AAV8ZA65_9CUCU|nr:hypothetical protein NQ318_008908 [Aromia moschata]
MNKMTGLETLNLSSCHAWDYIALGECLLDGLRAMKNLKSLCMCYGGTDVIVQVVGQNCSNIQKLELSFSGSMTDRCISYLLECKNLQELQLYKTPITVVGLSQLLMGLPKLQDIGRYDDFGSVINYLRNKYRGSGPLGLKRIQTLQASPTPVLLPLRPSTGNQMQEYYDVCLCRAKAAVLRTSEKAVNSTGARQHRVLVFERPGPKPFTIVKTQDSCLFPFNNYRVYFIVTRTLSYNLATTLSKVIKINLKEECLRPGNPKYVKIKSRLETLGKFTVIVLWEPPADDICPSSLAKYFFRQRLSNVDFASPENENFDFVEWLGMLSVGGDLECELPNFLSTFETPSPNKEIGQRIQQGNA